jgi:esterase
MLAHELTTSDAPPERWMLFLHGILGRRVNWRSFARSWVARRPGWGAVLVDLRDHGESQGLPGPRTVAAAGEDLVELAASVTAAHGGRVAGVLGHSFGGKVAIVGASRLRAVGDPVDELWIIDAPIGPRTQPRDRTTDRVMDVLRGLPARFDARAGFVDAVLGGGIAKPVAQWLATNLIEDDGGWKFGLDLGHIGELLADFMRVDLWELVDEEIEQGTRVCLVLGGRSQAVFGEELERARERAGRGLMEVFTVANAGHWVHVDNASGLLDVLGGG